MIISTKYTQVMLWLARYKYLSTDQIHEHLFHGTTKRNCEIALQRMEQKGLIRRSKLPRSQNLNFGFLCYLSKEGHELIQAEERSDNVRYAKYAVVKPITSINHYYHRKRLIDFFIKLDVALGDLVDNIVFVFEILVNCLFGNRQLSGYLIHGDASYPVFMEQVVGYF